MASRVTLVGGRKPTDRVSDHPHSRPASTRPPTRASIRQADDPGSFIVAVTSSQGTGLDIGIAAMHLETMKVHITQIADTHTYARTLHHLTLYRPRKIIVPDTFFSQTARKVQESALLKTCIENEFGLACEPVARVHWSADAGLEFIKRLSLDEMIARESPVSKVATLMAVEDKHFARCATSALFKYLEQKDDLVFSPSSVLIRYVALEGSMFIDHKTATSLELVSGNIPNSKNTLFGVIDHTRTPMARRLLRATILQPSNVEGHINRRLDVVDELLNTQDVYDSLLKAVDALPKIDIEKLVAKLISKKSRTPQTCGAVISNLLELRDVIQALPALADAACESRSELMAAVAKALADDRCSSIETIISDALTTDSTSRQSGWYRKHNVLFAVKTDYHKLLDVARETYKENCEDIAALADEINERYAMNCKLLYANGGYFLQTAEINTALSQDFIHVTQVANKLRFTHPSIVKANARLRDTEEEILLLSEAIVNKLREEVLQHIGCLYAISEAIALADLLLGFAEYAIGNQCVRPEFVDTLAISKGRHPILDVLLDGDLIPNDCYADDGLAIFQLIGGPNMAGKTTYLKMIGLLTIQAMLGSFVPAQYASVRLHDALLSKLSNGDCMQRELSTFAQEMSTMSMILGLSTNKTLVLIDELGRGTSPEEGVGMAHAIAVALMQAKTWTFFTTHFRALSTTLGSHAGFVNLHLAVQQATKAADRRMTFRYKVKEGPCLAERYGLELAKLASLPDHVIKSALEVSRALEAEEAAAIEASESNVLTIRRDASLSLLSKLEQTARVSLLAPTELTKHLQELQQECLDRLLIAKEIEDKMNHSALAPRW